MERSPQATNGNEPNHNLWVMVKEALKRKPKTDPVVVDYGGIKNGRVIEVPIPANQPTRESSPLPETGLNTTEITDEVATEPEKGGSSSKDEGATTENLEPKIPHLDIKRNDEKSVKDAAATILRMSMDRIQFPTSQTSPEKTAINGHIPDGNAALFLESHQPNDGSEQTRLVAVVNYGGGNVGFQTLGTLDHSPSERMPSPLQAAAPPTQLHPSPLPKAAP